MNEKTYNGWTNWETWNVKLWMDNDEGSQNYWQEQTESAWERAQAGGGGTRAENAKLALAKQLEQEYDDQSQELLETSKAQASVWSDLLGAALSEVNWIEIADSFLAEHVEDYSKVEETEAA